MNASKSLILPILCLSIIGAVNAAEPELKGTPAELQKFLRTATIAANGQRRDTLTQSLLGKGIDSKAIRVAKFSTSPQFGWFGKAPSSYEVVNRMTVDVSDEHQLTLVTASATESPDSSIGAIVFEYSKQRELEEKVRRAAFDDALAKKSFYEQRLSATLRPTEFTFSDLSARAPAGALALEEIIVTANRRSAGDSASSVATPPPPPSFGEKEYEVAANITFAIEPAAASH